MQTVAASSSGHQQQDGSLTNQVSDPSPHALRRHSPINSNPGGTGTSSNDSVGDETVLRNIRAGAQGFFDDLFRVRHHYRALGGEFGDEERRQAELADKIITAAGALYFHGAKLPNGDQQIPFRSHVNAAILDAVSSNKAYFTGRQLAQGSIVGLMSRYSGTGIKGGTVFTPSFFGVAGFGRALNLYDQGIRDPASLVSGAVTGK